MAILSNGKFYGFLCSAKETGQKLANGVKEYVEDFVSGFAGHGWKIWEYVSGKWMLEVDALRVRGQFTVFELLVSKIRAIIGAQAITQGCGKIKTVTVSDDGIAYLITIEDADMSFVEHDFIRCQEFSGGQKLYHVEIESVTEGVIRILKSEFDVDGEGVVMNPPAPGDDIVQFGNSSHDEKYIGRHSAIYMHADEGAQPAIDVLDGIYSKDWSDCLKVRMGGDIPGSNGLKGFYCVNGIIKGIDNGGSVLYQFNPDGSGFIGRGAIKWDADGFRFGTGVKLAWDNLDDETKENLKGEPGQDGKDGLDGVNGENGKDGLDIVWKGELSTSPANPQKNWVYRNTIDGRVYIYNGISWTLMVADGNDGMEGANGKDGKDVYITYHDSEEEPARPTGNGTTGGWHTNATAAVIWISQKVAENAETGEWGDPIKVKGNQGEPGKDANLLPWIEEWNGYATEIGGGYIVTPKMFSGTRSADGKLTGIAQGKDCLTEADGKKRTGIFALADNKIMFEMDPENGTYQFKGRIESDEIKINDFSKLSSAVFCGDYMYSQQGEDAQGNPTSNYLNFTPANPQGGSFRPNYAVNLKTGNQYTNGGHVYGFATNTPIQVNGTSIDPSKVAYSKVNILFNGSSALYLPNSKKFDGVEFTIVSTATRGYENGPNISRTGGGDTSFLYTGIYYKGAEIRTCYMRGEGSFIRLLAHWGGSKLRYYVVGHSDNFLFMEPMLNGGSGEYVSAGTWFIDRPYTNNGVYRTYYSTPQSLQLALAIYLGKYGPNTDGINFNVPS